MPRLAVLLTCLLAAAGCTTTPAPEGPAPTLALDDGSPPVLSPVAAPKTEQEEPVLQQFGCRSRYGFTQVDRAYAERVLPEGFEAELGGPVPVMGMGLLAIKAWGCAYAHLDGARIDAPQTFLYYLLVRPPEAYREADIAAYWYVLGWVSSTPEEAELFRRWNMAGAEQGEVSLASTDAGGASLGTATGMGQRLQGELFVQLDGSRMAEGFRVRYFGSANGTVTNAVDIVVHDGLQTRAGAARLTLEAEDAPGEGPMLGNASEQAWAADEISYTWTYVPLA